MWRQRLSILDIGRRIDQDEGDPTGLVRGVAPKVVGAALHDDSPLTHGSLQAFVKLELDLPFEHDAVGERVGAMHRAFLSRGHVDDAKHRTAWDRQAGGALGRQILDRIPPTDQGKLLDLREGHPVRMGIPSGVIRGASQSLAHRWSVAFHEHPEQIDGLIYPSRLNGETNLAIYERAVSKLAPTSTTNASPRGEHGAQVPSATHGLS